MADLPAGARIAGVQAGGLTARDHRNRGLTGYHADLRGQPRRRVPERRYQPAAHHQRGLDGLRGGRPLLRRRAVRPDRAARPGGHHPDRSVELPDLRRAGRDASRNSEGVRVQDAWFVGLFPDGRPQIAAEGSIQMHGLLEPTSAAPSDTGPGWGRIPTRRRSRSSHRSPRSRLTADSPECRRTPVSPANPRMPVSPVPRRTPLTNGKVSSRYYLPRS